MKFKQGLLLEGTRVSFHLSHQHSVNRGSSSARQSCWSPLTSQLCNLLHCRVWGGGGGVGQERRGGEGSSCWQHSLGAGRAQVQEEQGQSKAAAAAAHLQLVLFGEQQDLPSVMLQVLPLIQAELGPRRAVGAAAVTDGWHAPCEQGFGEGCSLSQ